MSARVLAFAVRAALVVTCLGLWFIVAAADDVPVPGLWPLRAEYQGDLLSLVGVALIYAVVAGQRRDRVRALLVFVPIAGIVYSCVSFSRLGDRWFDAGVPTSERPSAADR